MTQLTRGDLWSLEEYAEQRASFRAAVIAHKKTRQVALGGHARLYFEDATTIRYQIQEMLRIERVFEAEGIQDELDAYNPLIPDGHNWKATFMLEYDDPQERAARLAQMIGIEDTVWIQVGDNDKVYAIADEDIERANDTKTSSVHFMRWELTPTMIQAAQRGESITIGIEHPAYPISGVIVEEAVRASLVADLDASSIN